MTEAKNLKIPVAYKNKQIHVSGLFVRPRNAKCVYVMAHGAGADMHHTFMETMSQTLADRKIATLRFQFPYTEADRKAPDRAPLLQETIACATAEAHAMAGKLPIIAGGKSMGGRMTSLAQSAKPMPHVRGLVFLGFPLHAPNKPGGERADHLTHVQIPMLFLQGDRDPLAKLPLLRSVCKRRREFAMLHVINGGDHSFKVPKRSDRTEDDVFAEVGDTVVAWLQKELNIS